MAFKEHDFLKVNYTAKLKDGSVFDTTVESVGKEHQLGEGPFVPAVICLGEGFILPTIEKNLIGKEKGKYTFEIAAIDAFGKKDAKLIRLFPTNKFIAQNVMPEPGVVVNMDGRMGMIKTVTGGRTTVDFNHPLSGKDVVYEVEVLDIVTDAAEKVKTVVSNVLDASAHVEVKENKATVGIHHEIPPQILEQFKKKIIELTGVADVVFDVHKTH
jgi:FKBP-type peptidyl-prolyl cis-trans isomerase 2